MTANIKNELFEYESPPRCLNFIIQFDVKGISSVLQFILKTDFCATIIEKDCCKFYFPNLNALKTLDISFGVDIYNLSSEEIISEFRKNRRMIIVKNSNTPTLVTDEYRISFLISTLEGLYNVKAKRYHIIGNELKTKYIPKRPIHHTTAEQPTGIDNSTFGQILNPNQNALPFGGAEYKTPNYVKAPVQCSDISTDAYSFQSSLSASDNQRKATIVTNVSPNTNSSFTQSNFTTGFTFTNGFDEKGTTHSNASADIPTNIRNKRKPRYPNYSLKRMRLLSFKDHRWNEEEKPSAKILADWGLFATDRGDLVRCFFCGLGLKDWIKDDDPLIEHVKYSIDCDFLLQELGEDQYRLLKETTVLPESEGASSNQYGNQNGSHTTEQERVRHPRYQKMGDRLKSFYNFPRYITQTIRDLAVAGFFYTGDDDICRCFSCDIGLKDWAPGDVPLEEHAKYSPTCSYLRNLKGESYIQLVQQRHYASSGTTNSGDSNHDTTTRPPQTTTTTMATSMDRLTLETKQEKRRPSVDHNIMNTSAVRSVLEMGYTEEVIRQIIRKLHAKGKPNPSAQDILDLILDYEEDSTSNESNTQPGKNDKRQLLNENARLKESVLCMECHSAERNMLFLPCAHLCVCNTCARELDQCPQCDRRIREKIRTYMS